MAKQYISTTDPAVQKAENKLRARIRRYPVFKPGMSVAEYAEEYYLANAMRWVRTSFGIQRGAYTDIHERVALRAQVHDFFGKGALSEAPQYHHDDTVLEEVAA